jgi:hypothetical protein
VWLLNLKAAPTAGVGGAPQAASLRLGQIVPNPFVSSASIDFHLARREVVTLRILDLAGRQVRELIGSGEFPPGRHTARWDGCDDSGTAVPAGLYFCRLSSGTASETQRIVLER